MLFGPGVTRPQHHVTVFSLSTNILRGKNDGAISMTKSLGCDWLSCSECHII